MLIAVHVPGLLAESVGGARRFPIEATTLATALDVLRQRFPALRAHVWDEADRQRQHVLIYLNDESVTWIDDHTTRTLKPGDEIHIIQAVSGG